MAARKRTPRAQPAPAAEAILEEVEDSKGLNIDGGIVIATTILLLAAIVVVWSLMDARYPGA
jgi:hypothetical protein